MPLTLTQQPVADAAQIISLARGNEAVVPDPSDERQLGHLVAMHALGSITPECRNPQVILAELDPRCHQDCKSYLAERETVAG
jgi:hypothetical protein